MDLTGWLAPMMARRNVRRFTDRAFLQLAHARVRRLDRMNTAEVQHTTLERLIRKAERTRFGVDHGFSKIENLADYQARVPVREYEYFWNTYWKDAYPNFENLTWPGRIPYFALSSGTTSGGTKYLPISREMVASNRKAAHTTLSLFRHSYPNHQTFNGKFFFLGGNTDMRALPNGAHSGDLSAIAAREIPSAIRPYTFPSLELSRIPDWKEKIAKLAAAAAKEPITALSGVPSWMMLLFDQMKTITGKSTISEIWPDFRLLIHGGTKFDSYKQLFRQELGSDHAAFCEVYPSSEGFIATEDPRHELLRIVPDHNIFFEFIPLAELGKPNAVRHTLRNVELGVNYAIAVTSCAGVWSYLLGDTVMFEQREPPLIRFTGRTKYFLSAFGEHLISEEIEQAISTAAKQFCVNVMEHHVGPVFPLDPKTPGRHRYLIEFREAVPSTEQFIAVVDAQLFKLNEDYEAHRAGDITMRMPELVAVKPGAFREFMLQRKADFDVQGKVPRMDNSGKLTQEMFDWFRERQLIVG